MKGIPISNDQDPVLVNQNMTKDYLKSIEVVIARYVFTSYDNA